MIGLATPLRELEWIPPQRVNQFGRFGLQSVEDLLTHYPRRYEDRTRFDHFPQEESDTPVCVCGTVVKAVAKRLPGWKKMFEVTLEENDAHALSEPLVCRWFNVHFVEKMIATGQRLVVFGKPKLRAKRMVLDHPEFEIVENDDEVSIHLNRITPVHAATEGLTQRVIRQTIYRCLEAAREVRFEGQMPAELDSMPLDEALRQIHFPENAAQLAAARRHLVLAEFFAMQLFIGAKRGDTVSRRGECHCGSGKQMEKFINALPFPLTKAQHRAIAEIRADLTAPRPMNRLLHGDVGSGKTVVALSAMLLAVEAGFQAALMAPTQILAEQHFLNFKRWLETVGIGVALRTGARAENPLPLFSGEPQIVIGTHALLYEGNIDFKKLGLIVIDEQHKFGVMQRARLIEQASAPDVLVMTATPIPRTLTMTVYGDLDVSTLDEMPAHRGKIVTVLRDPSKLPEAAAFIRKHLAEGRQAYIVYPLIEESVKLVSKAAATEFEKWRTLLVPMKCELLHGRIDAVEKEEIMQRFRTGKTKALIATSVIEVGIDVPNANVMLIENAERFGLAQLHQLRGRIGRGAHKSFCILISSAENAEAIEKLRTLEATSDGFAIAEADLRLRGPGDILGTAQSGLPPLKLGDLLADQELMRLAREAAAKLFADDPLLKKTENKRFREMIVERKK
ncbi:MAG: ATP-dependent helicase RecG, partial [Chthoniobacter sp.]|nr:ATP-dependent helicase RecG [Chthoniobacter sp.]